MRVQVRQLVQQSPPNLQRLQLLQVVRLELRRADCDLLPPRWSAERALVLQLRLVVHSG
jgi:hypothetical protein